MEVPTAIFSEKIGMETGHRFSHRVLSTLSAAEQPEPGWRPFTPITSEIALMRLAGWRWRSAVSIRRQRSR